MASQEFFQKKSYFQSGQGASVMIFSLSFAASHLPQELQGRSEGQKGLPQKELCLALDHSQLDTLYITMYMAGTVHPNLGYIASEAKKAQHELMLLPSSRNPI